MSDLLLFMGGGLAPYTGATGWWRADAGVYSDAGVTPATDTQTVQQWNDQSGNAYHLSQSTGSARPTYRTGIVNGKPVLRFGGATDDDTMNSGAVTINSLFTSTAKTLFIVCYWTATTGSVWSCGNNYHLTYRDGSGITNYGHSGGYAIAYEAMSSGVWGVVTYMHNGSTLYAGWSDTRTSSMGSVAMGTSSSMTGIFILGHNSGANYFDGDVAEVVSYNTALSEANRQTTERYLAAKYGITLPY